MPYPFDEPSIFERVQPTDDGWTGEAYCISDVAGAKRASSPKHGEDFAGLRGQARLKRPIDRCGYQRQAHASSGLPVERIRKTGEAHLLEHPPDALPQLLAEVEVGTHSGDARVPGEPGGLEGVVEVDQTGEPTWTLDLDAVIEDLDAYVIASQAVAAMHNSVHDAFKPSVLRHQADIGEDPFPTENLSHWLELADLVPSPHENSRDRPVDPNVSYELLTSARSALGSSIPDDPNVCLGEMHLRIRGEQEIAGDGHSAIGLRESASDEKTIWV